MTRTPSVDADASPSSAGDSTGVFVETVDRDSPIEEEHDSDVDDTSRASSTFSLQDEDVDIGNMNNLSDGSLYCLVTMARRTDHDGSRAACVCGNKISDCTRPRHDIKRDQPGGRGTPGFYEPFRSTDGTVTQDGRLDRRWWSTDQFMAQAIQAADLTFHNSGTVPPPTGGISREGPPPPSNHPETTVTFGPSSVVLPESRQTSGSHVEPPPRRSARSPTVLSGPEPPVSFLASVPWYLLCTPSGRRYATDTSTQASSWRNQGYSQHGIVYTRTEAEAWIANGSLDSSSRPSNVPIDLTRDRVDADPGPPHTLMSPSPSTEVPSDPMATLLNQLSKQGASLIPIVDWSSMTLPWMWPPTLGYADLRSFI